MKRTSSMPSHLSAEVPSSAALRLRESPTLGVYVDNLTEVPVANFADVRDLMSAGLKARTVAATNMNNTSSRSHCIFTLKLSQTHEPSHDNALSEAAHVVPKVQGINIVSKQSRHLAYA